MTELKPCPFCGGEPHVTERASTQGEGGGFFCAIGCYCGGYSACAHQMANAATEEFALAVAAEKWNTRPARLTAEDREALIAAIYYFVGAAADFADDEKKMEGDGVDPEPARQQKEIALARAARLRALAQQGGADQQTKEIGNE